MSGVTFECPRCPVCGESATLVLNPAKVALHRDGAHVQDVWPELSADERELIISGTHAVCWSQLFGEDE